MTEEITSVACLGQCGSVKTSEQSAEAAGWVYLPVARAWRCEACCIQMRQIQGAPPAPFVDELPNDSIGKLNAPKGMMLPPSVQP